MIGDGSNAINIVPGAAAQLKNKDIDNNRDLKNLKFSLLRWKRQMRLQFTL